jgi:hypothetical protein
MTADIGSNTRSRSTTLACDLRMSRRWVWSLNPSRRREIGKSEQERWPGTLGVLIQTDPALVPRALQQFVPDAGPAQERAWRDSIRLLRTVGQAVVAAQRMAAAWGLVLDYEMTMNRSAPTPCCRLAGW